MLFFWSVALYDVTGGAGTTVNQLLGYQTYGRTNTALFLFFYHLHHQGGKSEIFAAGFEQWAKKIFTFYFVYAAKAEQNIET